MSIGGDFSSVLAVMMSFAAIGFVFPREVLTFRPKGSETRQSSSVAFAFLDAKAEEKVLRSVRDAWLKGGTPGSFYAELVFTELPPMPKCEVLSVETRGRSPAMPLVEVEMSPYLPSCRAPEPEKFAPEQVQQQLPFPREELLKIK